MSTTAVLHADASLHEDALLLDPVVLSGGQLVPDTSDMSFPRSPPSAGRPVFAVVVLSPDLCLLGCGASHLLWWAAIRKSELKSQHAVDKIYSKGKQSDPYISNY